MKSSAASSTADIYFRPLTLEYARERAREYAAASGQPSAIVQAGQEFFAIPTSAVREFAVDRIIETVEAEMVTA